MADAIRALSMDAVEAANPGHPGMPMVDGFGASGPIDDPYEHFGLTAARIAPRIVAALERE